MVNGFPVSSFRVDKLDQSGFLNVKVGSYLLKEHNVMTFQLISHYTITECEDPFHSTLWAVIGRDTKITIHTTRLPVKPSLSLLPYPFIDNSDEKIVQVPMFFAHTPSLAEVKAAGNVAAWFGKEADFYRIVKFPVLMGRLPEHGNAVLFLLGDSLPGLKDLDGMGSGIMIRRNPNDKSGMFLIIKGKNPGDLVQLSEALALGQVMLTGSDVTVDHVNVPPLRVPYDAPRWLPDDRPVKLSELASVDDLHTHGSQPPSLYVKFRFPPDLFGWNNQSADLNLKYRYTPTVNIADARMNINFNSYLLTSHSLQRIDENGIVGDVKNHVKKLAGQELDFEDEVNIPVRWFGFYNQIGFSFYDIIGKRNKCEGMPPTFFDLHIDGESTLDISRIPHYIRMPNVGPFLNGGFPFTRMADLSDTAVVLPDNIDNNTLRLYLQIMSIMGSSTGYPGVNAHVIHASDVDANADRDILVLGQLGQQPLLKRWREHMTVSSDGSRMAMNDLHGIQYLTSFVYDNPDRRRGGDVLFKSNGSLGLITGFQSPLNNNRSVIVVGGTDAQAMEALPLQLVAAPHIRLFHGDTYLIDDHDKVTALELADTYYAGKLPLLTSWRLTLSNSPFGLALLSILGVLLIGMLAYMLLRARAKWRLHAKKKKAA